MNRANPDIIIAHVDLLRSIDCLLTEAEAVRQKRAVLDGLLAGSPETPHAEGDGDPAMRKEVQHA